MTGEDNETALLEKIPVGISSCLLGLKVRFDGGHKGHSYITNTLGEYFEFRAFCPEMEIGLGVPRKAIRLARSGTGEIRCISVDNDGRDFTEALQNCADRQVTWQQQLCGYILKKDSPSCGMERVKIWSEVMPIRRALVSMPGRCSKIYPGYMSRKRAGSETRYCARISSNRYSPCVAGRKCWRRDCQWQV